MRIELKQVLFPQPKSKIKAGDGKAEGKYKFFTSSPIQSKFVDEANYDKPSLIFGTGGNASVHFCNEPFSTSTDCLVMYGRSQIELETIYNYLKSNIGILENGFKGAGLKHISKEYILAIEIELPSEEIQLEFLQKNRIIDGLIEAKQAQLHLSEELVKSRFIEMFGDGKYPMKTLPQIITKDKHSLKRGPFGGALKKEDFVENGYLVYEQRHAIHNDFEYEKYYIAPKKYQEMILFKVVPGDLIISCSGVTLGRIAEIPPYAKEGIINQALLKVTLDQSIMTNTFFIHQFRSDRVQDILFGFCRGSGIPNFPSMNEVKAVEFICPPIELQNQFAAFVEQIDKSKFEIQKSLEKLEILKKSLMQQYFG